MVLSTSPRVYVFGASGTGTTTLGRSLSSRVGVVQVDSDDHFWRETNPPYTEARDLQDRRASIEQALGKAGWVLTGACHEWASYLIEQADLIVFMTLSAPLRLERLRARERVRFGSRIDQGGDMFQTHHRFLYWSLCYDIPEFHGRCRNAHETWLSRQGKPVCRIDGDRSLDDSEKAILSALNEL